MQVGQDFLLVRQQERRQGRFDAKLGVRLVDGEARTVGGDFEQHAAGLAEVGGEEVETVDFRRDVESTRSDEFAPLLVTFRIGCAEGDVVDTAPPDPRRWRIGLDMNVEEAIRSTLAGFEGDDLLAVVFGIVSFFNDPISHHIGEDRQGYVWPTGAYADGGEPDNRVFERDAWMFPWYSGSDWRVVAVAHQGEALALTIAERQHAPTEAILHIVMIDVERVESRFPEAQAVIRRHSEGDLVDLPAAGMVAPRTRDIEKRQVGAGISNAVGEKEVVDGDVILVDGFLDDAHAERLRVEIDGALGIGGDGADVMNSGEGSVWSFHDGLPFCCWVVQV